MKPKEAAELDGIVEKNFGKREAKRLRRADRKAQTRALNELIYRKTGPIDPTKYPIPRDLYGASGEYFDSDE